MRPHHNPITTSSRPHHDTSRCRATQDADADVVKVCRCVFQWVVWKSSIPWVEMCGSAIPLPPPKPPPSSPLSLTLVLFVCMSPEAHPGLFWEDIEPLSGGAAGGIPPPRQLKVQELNRKRRVWGCPGCPRGSRFFPFNQERSLPAFTGQPPGNCRNSQGRGWSGSSRHFMWWTRHGAP